jgi:multicomponent Na+:H+ antiporter subunit C
MEIISARNISILIFFVGFCGLIIHRNIIKSIVCLGIMQAAIMLFFITAAYVPGSVPPIDAPIGTVVSDPLPQALMITDIVIGVGVTAMALTMFIHLYHEYGTKDWRKAAAKREE